MSSPFRYSNQMYTTKLILYKTQPTLSGWIKAVRFGYLELAEYYRSSPVVKEKLRQIIGDAGKGLKYLLDQGVSLEILSPIVAEMARLVGPHTDSCVGCGSDPYDWDEDKPWYGVCHSCNMKHS